MRSLDLPDRVSLATLPTPITPLDRLSDALRGPRIWMKRDDRTGAATSGNKIRKLEFAIADALAQGADTLITTGAVQSNHCRATAIAGAELGLNVHLILRGEAPSVATGNLLLDQLVDASITYVAESHYNERLDTLVNELMEDYAETGRHAYFIPTGASYGVGLWGYIAASQELRADYDRLGMTPGHLVLATGSGGTQAGLLVGHQMLDMPTEIWGVNVCDDAGYFERKIASDVAEWASRYHHPINVDSRVNIIEGYKAPGYGRPSPEVVETIAYLGHLEGLILDPVYTGKAMHGLISELKEGRFDGASDIVFLYTGGIFGIFAHAQLLAQTHGEH